MSEIYKLSELSTSWIKGGIYKINFPNGKCYIGLSNNIRRRMQDHNQEATRKARLNIPLNNALIKYGLIEEFEVLEFIDPNNRKKLSERERYWISYYKSNKREYGYNVTEGGEGTSIKGCDNPHASLNEKELKEIIDLLKNSNKSMNKIAELYNVNSNTIININHGKSYVDKNLKYPIRSKENIKEIQGRSTNLAHAKISDEDADYIKYLLEYTNVPMSEMEKEFNVDPTTILAINIGKTRKEKDRVYPIRDKEKARKISNNNKNSLNKEIVLSIIEDLRNPTLSNEAISRKYNVGTSSVRLINQGKHKYCPKDIEYPVKTGFSIKKNSLARYNKEEEKMNDIIELLKTTDYSFTKIGEITGIDRKRISKINSGEIYYKDELKYPIRNKNK